MFALLVNIIGAWIGLLLANIALIFYVLLKEV